ncbi:hypothetical protein hmeg3_21230 [Herbaspirillum sp. meg3]|uniref:ABC transporter ATP-binding protein n=1 Tax=Herbaspirillum sp. meg3 TaxID=2025949 RepID=UPI000B9923E6|nr:ABC transporter ATP-binding protein [Herbaspirillum sp. meg3]ASU40572.1 hypothetical protein hmeg3_21230 [Herbaspirillum sp. meg3]
MVKFEDSAKTQNFTTIFLKKACMIRQLWTVLRDADDSKFRLPLFFLSCVVVALLELIGVGVIPLFVTVLLKPELLSAANTKYFHGTFDMSENRLTAVLLVGLTISAFLAAKAAITLLLGLHQNHVLARYQTALSSKLLTRYLTWPYETHLQKNSSELVRNAINVPVSIVNSLLSISVVATESLLIVFAAALLIAYHPIITLVSITLLGMIVGALFFFFKSHLARLGKEANSAAVETMKWINQTLGGIKEIKVAHRESYFHDRYLKNFKDFSELTLKTQYILQAPRLFMELVAILAMVALAALLMSYDKPENVLPIMALFGAASLRLIPSANRVWNAIATIRTNIVYIDTYIADIAHAPPPEQDNHLSLDDWTLCDGIHFSNVGYSYEQSQRPALEGLEFSVPRGRTVGIAGRSGAGKSTLLDILLGLHHSDSGDITVDGKSIWSNLRAWRATIGYVPQQIFLLDDTIRRNIALGENDDNIDDARINTVLTQASLHDFVSTLPLKLNTRLGERGARLSGGQRQRIGIARALYRRPSVLILDEATSALDHETEQAIAETLQKLRGEITIFIIAHHSATMLLCDDIHVLDQGKLVTSGTPAELEEKGIHFK